ncbi:MAG: carboxypeptidase-like regulatory domain-containing protein, partial [Terriglobia bacterium]
MCFQPNLLRVSLGILLALMLLSPSSIHAQTAATLVGDITDSSGAIAPNVSVTVIHEGTRTERKVQTNEAGQYRVTPLNPGTYTIQVESAGFKKEVRSGVVLEVGGVLEVDFALQVGELTETIEVTGVTPTLRTEEASVGNVVTGQE